MSNRVFDPRAVQYWRLEVRADGSVAHRGALASQAELGAAHARANASATSRGGSGGGGAPGLLLGLGDGRVDALRGAAEKEPPPPRRCAPYARFGLPRAAFTLPAALSPA